MLRLRPLIARFWLLPAVLVTFTTPPGCARKTEGPYSHTRAILAETDDFGLLLLGAGLAPEVLPTGPEVTVKEAERLRLLLKLLLADGSMQRYGPRVTADFLLEELQAGGKPVARSVLGERLRRFESLTVLRPDGYLASVLTGSPVQCVGPVQVQQGALMAGDYKVGAFYAPEAGGFREDTHLPRLPGSASVTSQPPSSEAE
jgi:hypothetical protein